MSQSMVKSGFQQAKKLLVIQFAAAVLVALFGLFIEFWVAVALLSGGVAVFIGNSYFVYKAFSKSGANANKQVVKAFYLGETLKIVISISLLVIGFVSLVGNEIYVLMGYVMALLLQWITPAIVKTH